MTYGIDAVMALAFPITLKNCRGGQEYDKLLAKYENATPTTNKIAREIEKKSDASDRVKVQRPIIGSPGR